MISAVAIEAGHDLVDPHEVIGGFSRPKTEQEKDAEQAARDPSPAGPARFPGNTHC